MLGSPSLAEYKLQGLDARVLGIKGRVAVLTDARAGECVGYDSRVATDCENSIVDCDGSPEKLFGTAWRPEVTGQPERATEWPGGV